MKLLMENWRQYIDEQSEFELLKEEAESPVVVFKKVFAAETEAGLKQGLDKLQAKMRAQGIALDAFDQAVDDRLNFLLKKYEKICSENPGGENTKACQTYFKTKQDLENQDKEIAAYKARMKKIREDDMKGTPRLWLAQQKATGRSDQEMAAYLINYLSHPRFEKMGMPGWTPELKDLYMKWMKLK